jgi:hypothetical protein
MRVARSPKRLETTAEWDVTPGLHDWVEQEVANAPASDARWSKLAQALLAMHKYMHSPSKRAPSFYCETCHVDDGIIEGGGNCETVLALAEAYGLDEPGEQDVEVIRG